MSKSTQRPDADNQAAVKPNDDPAAKQKRAAAKTGKDSTPKIRSGRALSIAAILISLATASGIFLYTDKMINSKQAQIDDLTNQLSSFKQLLNKQQQQEAQLPTAQAFNQLQQTLTEQQQNLQQTQSGLEDIDQQLASLREKFQAMSPNDSSWQIAQANYLVTLAGRKIWSDEDFTTALLLLKSADRALAEIQDPSLLPIRKAVNQDISTLAAIEAIDADGIRIKLMQLANQVDQLPLVHNYQQLEQSEVNQDDRIADKNPSLWQRFVHSSKRVMHKFVQVEQVDSYTNCVSQANNQPKALAQCQIYKAITTPDQALYLRENVRMQLLLAAQSVARHQQQSYLQAMQNAYAWSYAYFDTTKPNTRVYLDQLKELAETSIEPDNIPQQLQSAPMLQRLLQSRFRDLSSKAQGEN